MNPAQSLELGFLEALDANGQAIDAQCPVSDEFLLFESPRVGFQGDFNVMGEGYSRLDTFEQPAPSLGAEQAWGSAAEKDRAQLPAIHRLQVLVEVGPQRGRTEERRVGKGGGRKCR